MPRKFFTGSKRSGIHFFRPGPLSRAKSENFSKSKKLNFGGQNDLKMFFSKCFYESSKNVVSTGVLGFETS